MKENGWGEKPHYRQPTKFPDGDQSSAKSVEALNFKYI